MRSSASPRAPLVLAVALAVLVAACSGSGSDGAAARSTATTRGEAGAPSSEPPARPSTTTTVAGVSPAPAQAATPSCPAVPAMATPDPARPRYLLDIDVRPDEGVVEGRTTVRFTPDLPTDRLVFRLWPNGPRTAAGGASLEVEQVLVGVHPAMTERPDPTILVVRPPAVLDAGDTVEAVLAWRLTLPGALNDRISRDGGAIRLGSFFPILAWERGVGWAVEPATSGFAEASLAPVADFAYSVTVPPGLDVLASGTPDGDGRWEALAVRDVAVSVGRFALAEGVAMAPGPVRVSVGVHEGVGESPEAYRDKVVRSLEDFATRFGPYPYGTLSFAITPGLRGGIEYPGHVMQGPGTIGRTTSHEVGHMWFYSLVGNNQGRDPWLDEGLASWAEARFEGALDSFRSRAIPSYARGRLGAPMTFWEDRQDGYYRGVYVQGAQALAALGPADLVDCALRHYVARHAFDIARPADLADSLSVVFPDARQVLASYGAL